MPRHRVASLFSGCLGLELGWKQWGPKVSRHRSVLISGYLFCHCFDNFSFEVYHTHLLCEELSRVRFTSLLFSSCQPLEVLSTTRSSEVEMDPFCKSIISQRAQEGLVPDCPIFSDIRKLHMSDLQQDPPSGLMGGFPCQVGAPAWLSELQYWSSVLYLFVLAYCRGSPKPVANLGWTMWDQIWSWKFGDYGTKE